MVCSIVKPFWRLASRVPQVIKYICYAVYFRLPEKKKKTGKSIFNLSWKTWTFTLIAATTFLWLKCLVLISFPYFAGLFDLPKLDTKEHDYLKYKTRDKYQSWKERKIGSTPAVSCSSSTTAPTTFRQFS